MVPCWPEGDSEIKVEKLSSPSLPFFPFSSQFTQALGLSSGSHPGREAEGLS